MSTIDYVKIDTTPLYSEATNGSPVLHLLWGDRVEMDGDELKSPLLYSTELARSLEISSEEGRKVVKGLVYGLVNIRTDGRNPLCNSRREDPDLAHRDPLVPLPLELGVRDTCL